ncbi:hypothetical protein [Geomesophilobacter sediminis]|uniref:Uncharacterized protein n=1 Tax=Geomesophilobacter sediminis TaxID=2798584 RepID=A0A8J7JEZ4_9BACT|nr:hypothetical protein [Geomesophilobacter sediminis]MBJ6724764.1 hypothetical protein [Geomesophilobacter sediminis]
MPVYLTLDLTGKDAVFISNSYRYHSGLSTLAIYHDAPAELGTGPLKVAIDGLQLAFEGGKTGNHAQIRLRKTLRKQVTEMFKKILHYLQCVATEDDIPALIQAGFGVRQFGHRKKVVPAPA